MRETEIVEKIVYNVSKAILGKEREIYDILKAIVAKGHILIEDVPGIGKTTLVKALAKSLQLQYKRIQFTTDLLPSDILGISIYNDKQRDFEFRKGPIFSNIILADEINRTSPKTQSALLEVMEEKQVTEGNETYKLQEPFIVIATQNPIEFEGTFILPEAQLDRFIIKINLGYPDRESEMNILKIYSEGNPLKVLESVVDREDILMLQRKLKETKVNNAIIEYIVKIIEATRKSPYIELGASPRASLALIKISQATAIIKGRYYVIPEDVKENIIQVLAHRIRLSSKGRLEGITEKEVLSLIINTIPLPKIKGDFS
ncbi:magnesium chelatase [Clostridium tetani]|uniref:AAA family ATPase n=1 Tax=Clostridium tetani TaxID=1513 RepID=UPI0029546E23|nr:MoxR family ATPase [Clostridium tetani]BDR65967.1 magnesium chelatase [Clostridium tetani]